MKAIVLLGHSNAGKTPVGELLARSLPGRHLDFGAQLRLVAAGRWNPGLTPAQVERVRAAMDGRLLGDEDFPIAAAIVKQLAAGDVLVLNGLPRNLFQARGLAEMGVGVSTVVFLDCPPEEAWRRKARSEEGRGFEGRSDRDDRSREVFDRKVRSFVEETMPLLDWYRGRGAQVVRVAVGVETSPEDVLRAVLNPSSR